MDKENEENAALVADPPKASVLELTKDLIKQYSASLAVEKGEDNDEWAIANNYVSVVPCQFDLTAHQAIPVLNEDWEILAQ